MSENLSDIWKLKKRGARDSERAKELIKKAIKENGKDLITEYNIIKSHGSKKVKVPIKFLDKYSLRYGKLKKNSGTGQGMSVSPGDRLGKPNGQKGPGQGKAGNEEGEDIYEAEVSIDELVNILLEELNLPWMDPKNSTVIEVETEDVTSIDKKGILPNLDLKRTLYENLKRNAARGNPHIGGITSDDFKFKTWEVEKEYHSNAAVYLMMDRSGSMIKDKTDIAKSFYFWMVQFLRKRYKNVELVFVAHDIVAKITDEDSFFKILPSGGTKCSSAFKLAYENIQKHHSPDIWNNYVIEFSDGDNYGEDNDLCVDYVQKLLPLCRAIGYGEIVLDDYSHYLKDNERLSYLFEKSINRTRFVSMRLSKKDDVIKSLKDFFNVDGASKKKK